MSAAVVAPVESFGPWVRQWRHLNRWTQEKLAEELGYDVSYVAKIERGTRRPTSQFLARLATVAEVDSDELVRMSRRPSARIRLPLPSQPLVGRADEVGKVTDLLRRGGRCVTVVGAPGIGKTSLAMEAAWQLGDHFRHGACFVPLAEVAGPDGVATGIVHRLGLHELSGHDPETLLASYLRHRALLLVLDNFEHVLAAKMLVGSLIAQAPQLKVLVTSREALGIEDEIEFQLRTLSFPDPYAHTVEDVESYPAVRVFVDRSRMARPSFVLNDENRRPVLEICARLDGLPLALNLTATATRVFSPSDIARTLRERLELPGEPADPFSHRGLGSALDWSWELLDPPQRRLLCRLGVFAGGFTLAAAEAVCDEAGADVVSGLSELAAKSLVEVDHGEDGATRFSCLETVRRYALQRLAEQGDFEDRRRRHCQYFVGLAREAEARITGHPDQARWLRQLDGEYPNLATAFEWAAAREPETALLVAGALARYFALHRLSDGRKWLEKALERAPAPSPARIKALNGYGVLLRLQGELDGADAALSEARSIAARLGDANPRDLAATALAQAAVADDRGRFDESESFLQEAAKLSAAAGDTRGAGHGLNNLGVIALRRNDPELATTRLLEAMRMFRSLQDWWSVAVAATNLGWTAEIAGELQEAREWYDEARQLRTLVGDEHGLARTSADLGRVSRLQRDFKRARARLEAALVGFHRLGDRRLAAACLVELAYVALERKRRDLAARMLGAAGALRESLGAPAWPEEAVLEAEITAEVMRAMGDAAARRGLAVGRSLSLEDAVDMVESDSWPPVYRGRRIAR